MATIYAPMPPPLRDPTPRLALERAEGREPYRRLEVPLGEWCGDALVAAFERLARAYYAERAA